MSLSKIKLICYLQYSSVEARASSYDNETWHNRENEDTPPAEELANSGFYFVGGLEQGREGMSFSLRYYRVLRN